MDQRPAGRPVGGRAGRRDILRLRTVRLRRVLPRERQPPSTASTVTVVRCLRSRRLLQRRRRNEKAAEGTPLTLAGGAAIATASTARVVSRSAEQKQKVYYPRVSAEAEDVRYTIRGFGVLIKNDFEV